MTAPVPKEKARQGVTGTKLRYVLAISVAGAAVALVVAFAAAA